MTIWFSSDTHYRHTNIIEYCARPYQSVEEMNQTMIDNWNAKVSKKDITYHLGDFCFGGTEAVKQIVDSLNGEIHLVKGNHDYKWSKPAFEAFDSVKDLREIKIDGQRIVMCHFPLLTWHKSGGGSWDLHGHSHGNIPFDPEVKRLDVGVDVHDFSPISFEEVREIFNNPQEYSYKLRN